jgi:hypothetical protein
MKFGVLFTCFDEIEAVDYSISTLKQVYPDVKIFLVSEKEDFSFLEKKYSKIYTTVEEDTMSSTFKITDRNFLEEEHQKNIKTSVEATLKRILKAISYCDTEYLLMMDPDALVRGELNIPNGVKLLGSKVNKPAPIKTNDVLKKVNGSIFLDGWGATPGIFECQTFLKAYNVLIKNEFILDELCKSFYALYAHDFLIPVLFALIGEEESFNPDIIECNRVHEWFYLKNPLVHQFKEFYPKRVNK